MKIIRDKTTLRVPYIFHDAEAVEIAEGLFINGQIYAGDIRPETHELVEGVSAPDLFVGNALAYDNGWTVVDAEAVTNKMNELKASKLQAVQAEKVRVRDGGFLVAGVLFDSDISARTSYQELALRLSQNPAFETQWKASQGQWVTMDAALYAQVMTAGEAHIAAVFAWQAAKEVEIGECQTVEELEVVVTTY